MENDIIRMIVRDGIAVVTIDNPPVNALSNNVRRALIDTFAGLRERSGVSGIILTGVGRNFIAGADIAEMNLPPEEPFLPQVVSAIEEYPIPVLAAINGACLGGGLEIAMACDLRVAVPAARLGLPETLLGIVPGAGGTQRLPRLVGLEQALSMICEARTITGNESAQFGLVDAVADDPLEHAIGMLSGAPKSPSSARPVLGLSPQQLDTIRQRIMKRHGHSKAVATAFDLVSLAATVPFSEGLRQERDAFLALRGSAEAEALRYVFKAERSTVALSGAKPDLSGIHTVGIVGGGTMGSAIAISFVQAGFSIMILERDQAAMDACNQRVDGMLEELVKRQKLTTEQAVDHRGRIHLVADQAHAAICDLVIEAVFEDYAAKEAVFVGLRPHLRPGTLLATNTSYLDIDRLAQFVDEPGHFFGLHFFAPAHLMRLVEVVKGGNTTPETIATAVALGRKLGKLPVVAANAEGFIGNRIFAAYRRHMEYLVEDGASPANIDAALEGYGFAMGPFAVFDMSGLDIAWAMRKRKAATRDPKERYVAIADHLCEQGMFGRKSGRGWYDYSTGQRRENTAATAIIDAERQRLGILPRLMTTDDIVACALSVMAQEGAKLLAEGVAAHASDIDLVMLNGYGFPRNKGGPMFAAAKGG